MASPRGSAAYKKKDGTVTLSPDQTSMVWTPTAAGLAGITINIADITNLQQTPETAEKVMLKIFVKPPDAPEPVTHLFHFNAPSEPRSEANAIKDVLTSLIASLKAGEPSIVKANGATGTPGAMAIASAVASKPSGTPAWYDDNQLKNDFELQQALMRKDPLLLQTYEEARRTKPDTTSNTQFNTQFWSTRINLLRAYAVENNQQRGAYNVLSVVKPRQEDGELKLRISKEQVQLIFSQHPLVKRVYDENVPKLNESEFWSRFFLSRLFKKLKGERIVEADSVDSTFDRYLDAPNSDILGQRLAAAHIPHVIDIEGNEENQGGSKGGNRQDFTMRPSSSAKAPIIRTLNSLSEKIMENVAQSDVDPSAPIGLDEKTFNELALRDLQGGAEENRIMLNIKEQSQFFSNDKSQISVEAAVYAKQDPNELLMELNTDLDPELMDTDAAGGLDLRTAIGVNEESDSDDDEDRPPHVGSRSSFIDAQKQIFEGITQQRTRMDGSDPQANLSGLSQALFDRLTLTHATTTEFLHHFWSVFLCGDPDRAGELAKLVETLERALDRINAVAADAEKERNDLIKSQKQQIRELWEKTGKKMQYKPELVGGGEKVVREMLEPTIFALDKASKEYRKALAAEGVDTS
ncbi:RNA polymerase II transcription factor B subunit 1 [Pseudogymnoascus verrucosus]|uniref:RNA polymerase II transcription factor B subunit 1 n=1 Tax=Pseudogymnoascus verrucosus TaxID=342668 RepID=A0A1B8GKV9_9PEZI|nr:RNA polymerase II transcription factor B subunit 1 [Pseudogymnoascus verrucosus]OBT96467.1 RNA polymerase II transcription factor B subunit 1 [Pseudogymnoascus verrucosus]